MDARKVISLVEGYREINSESLSELAKWKKEYPWFSALHTLEAKCLHNDKKFGLKKALKCASLYSGDREQLYDFMHDIVEFEVKPELAPSKMEEQLAEPEVASKPIELPSEEPTDQDEEIVSDEIEKGYDITQPVTIENDVTTSDDNSDDVELAESHEEVVEEVDSKAETESTIEPIEEVLTKDETPKIVYDPLKELSALVDDDDEIIEAPDPTPVYDPLTELPKLADQEQTEPDRQDFLSWLDSMDHEEEPTAPKPRKLQMTEEAAALLDNFIKNRPRISKIRTDIDRTKVYQSDDSGPETKLVSESLANLHLKQGRPEKALEILDILRLQNPEKMTYFAALIEKIKKEHSIDS